MKDLVLIAGMFEHYANMYEHHTEERRADYVTRMIGYIEACRDFGIITRESANSSYRALMHWRYYCKPSNIGALRDLVLKSKD